MSSHRAKWNNSKKIFGREFGESVTVSNVDYTALDQTATSPVDKMYFLEPEGPQFAQAPLPNGSYYCVHGDFFSVNPGDVVTPIEAGTSSPKLTILSKAFLGEIVGFRTSRVGKIMNGETDLYINILWDVAPTTYLPQSGLARELMASPHRPSLIANMYARDLRSTGQNGFDTEGLLFVETDVSPQVYWTVHEAVTVSGIMQLRLELSRVE